MLKYLNSQVTLGEIPKQLTLCINITGCTHNCDGCHSPELREDIGEPLTDIVITELIRKNKGISCVLFMGGDHNIKALNKLIFRSREKNKNMLFGAYFGCDCLPENIELGLYNYIKLGHYDKELGGLKSPTTNQKLFTVTANIKQIYLNNGQETK